LDAPTTWHHHLNWREGQSNGSKEEW
jgi:hypothetical protein